MALSVDVLIQNGLPMPHFARAGVQQYVILNLRNRTAEVYTNPDTGTGTYPLPQVIVEGEPLSLRVSEGEHFTILLTDLLP